MRRTIATLSLAVLTSVMAVGPAFADDADTDMHGTLIGALGGSGNLTFHLDLAGTWDGLPAFDDKLTCHTYGGGVHCAYDYESYAVGLNSPAELYGPSYSFTGTPDAWLLTASLTGSYEADELFPRAAGTYELSCHGGRSPYELLSPDPNWPGIFGVCNLT